MRTDRWTDMMKLTVAFRNLANAPTKGGTLHNCTSGLRSQTLQIETYTATIYNIENA